MFQTFNFLYSFFSRTTVHVPDFQFFIIWAVDIFQCFCRAVAIRAVVHFGLKFASAQNDIFLIFEQFSFFWHLLEQCRAVDILVSSSFFEQMNFEQLILLLIWENDLSRLHLLWKNYSWQGRYLVSVCKNVLNKIFKYQKNSKARLCSR